MIELTATGEWYHVSAESENSASKWVEGPLRKGLYQGKRNLSLVTFDRREMEQANPDDRLIAMELVLQRDTSYGDGSVTLTVAPVINLGALPSGYVSRGECMDLAERQVHHQLTVSGETCVIQLPTWVTIDWWDGHNSFLIYHEEDEKQDQYIRFLAGAKLRLYFLESDGWRPPTWIRPIMSGDVICDSTHSHYADLIELREAIKRRWEWVDGGGYVPDMTFGPYEFWPDNIQELQDCVRQMLEDEGADPVTMTVPTSGMMPCAALINELRAVLDGTGESVLPSTTSLCAQQQLVDSSARYNESQTMTWAATDVQAGKRSEQRKVYVYEQGEKTVTVYWAGAGGWLFDKTNMAGMSSAKLRLKVTTAGKDETQVRVVLYGIKVTQMPAGSQSYASVFDTTALGEADCIVGAQTEIQLSAYAVQQLREQDGGYGGIGIRYDNPYIVCSRSAELLMNAGTSTEVSA